MDFTKGLPGNHFTFGKKVTLNFQKVCCFKGRGHFRKIKISILPPKLLLNAKTCLFCLLSSIRWVKIEIVENIIQVTSKT